MSVPLIVRIRILPAILILSYSTSASAQSSDPDSATIVTEDIGRFWEAFDEASPEFAPEVFQRVYLSRGTAGLEDFIAARIESAEELATVVRAHPRYYASIRESTQRIASMEYGIRAAFYAMKYLYPEAVFPDVYFLIGKMNSGGTTSSRGLLIGAEMYGKTPEMPVEELGEWHRQVLKTVEAIPQIVAHELIHYQQKYPQMNATLLAVSIMEGVADFVAEMISGNNINEHVHRWADPREEELWSEFQQKMKGDDYTGWLYNGDRASGRPADLGYWMGYKIAQAYYERTENKRQAIKDMMQIESFDAFLEASGYASKFGR